MQPNILSDYLDRVEQAIQQCSNVYVERYEEEILTPKRANLRIRLRFNQTYLLEINEAVVVNALSSKLLTHPIMSKFQRGTNEDANSTCDRRTSVT
jgi:hypothetical protein